MRTRWRRPENITSPRLLYLKGGLFVVAGALATGMLVMEHPDLRVAALHLLAVWCFARAYYFAFYVIEHYVDGRFRFVGLVDFVRWLGREDPEDGDPNPRKPPHRP